MWRNETFILRFLFIQLGNLLYFTVFVATFTVDGVNLMKKSVLSNNLRSVRPFNKFRLGCNLLHYHLQFESGPRIIKKNL